ncbi:hypothetical protein PC110_g3586 [Phytophthora cactorum]|uniref:Reverse transcriptase Ty1/copia-type domain-containing protein n=1 Tax=Phytophthora cactorum TaxID=29920 RepID=A0A329SWL0_9STRA|nr:hypothetical protein PC110_g3586 [Phytophthora cactorum]
MGYAKHSESYRILNLTNGNINEVRSVEFQEDWTVERSYVGHLLSNRHGKGRYVLPAIIPYVHLPVLNPVTHGSKRSSVEPDDRPTKRCRCDDRAVCDLPVETGGGPAAVSTDASGRWLLSGNEVPASSAEAQTQPTPAGVPQSGGHAPGFEPFMHDGSGLGIVDLPNSGHGDTVQILPNCDGSPSVGVDYGLVRKKLESPDLHFTAYADADLGNEKDDRHSITGFVLQLNGCTFAYKSRKQRVVTDDTCCVEFIAASECSTMIMWTHNLSKELGLKRHHPTVLHQDNQAAIVVLTEITGNYKTKVVDLKYHKVCPFHKRGEFEVRYCPSTDTLADIFTKPLGHTLFKKFRQLLNVMPLPMVIDDGNTDGRD